MATSRIIERTFPDVQNSVGGHVTERQGESPALVVLEISLSVHAAALEGDENLLDSILPRSSRRTLAAVDYNFSRLQRFAEVLIETRDRFAQ